MIEKFIYAGPSWAERSYDRPDKNVISTSLAEQWKIGCINISQAGTSVLQNIDQIKKINSNLPIIWIYNEPILDLFKITGILTEEFLYRNDWQDIWNICNQYCLKSISDLNRPILLIGGHSDIVNCNYPNITIAHESWQKFIAEKSGMTVTNNKIHVNMYTGGEFLFERCWGADVVHKWMHNYPNIDPPDSMVNSVFNMLQFFKKLQNAGWFWEVHPNRLATEKFADFSLLTVLNFLDAHK